MVIFLMDPCTGMPRDSAVLIIQDGILLEATADPSTIVCPGDTIQLLAVGGIDYTWDPEAAWPGSLLPDPVITPLVSGWYSVNTEVGSCFKSD